MVVNAVGHGLHLCGADSIKFNESLEIRPLTNVLSLGIIIHGPPVCDVAVVTHIKIKPESISCRKMSG